MLYRIPERNLWTKDTHAYHDAVFSQCELDRILALPEWESTSLASIGGSSQKNVVDPSVRVSRVAWLGTDSSRDWIWQRIVDVAADMNAGYFGFDLSGCHEPIQLGIYKSDENGNYNWHTDASPSDRGIPRKLSMSLTLSDPSEYQGGELQIKAVNDIPVTLNCPRGRAWFFPSYTLHRVAPVTKGVRKSLVLWMGGPSFR